MRLLVGAVGIEIASLKSKSRKRNGVAPPPLSNWSLLEPSLAALLRQTYLRNFPLGGASFATRLLISAVSLQRAACKEHQPGGGANDISSNQVCASKLHLSRHDCQVLQRTMRNDGRHAGHRMRLPTPRMRRPHGSQLASDRLEQASAPQSSVPMVKPAASPPVPNRKIKPPWASPVFRFGN